MLHRHGKRIVLFDENVPYIPCTVCSISRGCQVCSVAYRIDDFIYHAPNSTNSLYLRRKTGVLVRVFSHDTVLCLPKIVEQ